MTSGRASKNSFLFGKYFRCPWDFFEIGIYTACFRVRTKSCQDSLPDFVNTRYKSEYVHHQPTTLK